VDEQISAVQPDGVRTADGELHELDVLIMGTGFAATEFLAPMRIRGSDHRDLHEEWATGARAHLGITVPGFPNFFMLYGPNTNLGGSSVIAMLEAQATYVAQAATDADRRGGPITIRENAANSYDDEVQGRLSGSVWSSCASWYREPGGRITTNWPGTVTEYQDRTARFDPTVFETLMEPQP
ncbi:MAG: 4-hydroxyacetophenone monooxygenase, partial [Nocardioidaceae bacterium]|nr:4-hydroxyacetophenone monooxygenase [Nocardioidaceae bacterium]